MASCFLEGTRSKKPWVFVQKCFDGTPVEVDFGNLAHLLCPHAKYRYKRDSGSRWQMLTYDQLISVGRSSKKGVLELFA